MNGSDRMNNILVIGIAGGTGSGKTTLMNRIIERFSQDVTVDSLIAWCKAYLPR